MPDLNPSETLIEYERMVGSLLARSTKAQMRQVIRVLASSVGHYQLRHGVISAADLATIKSASPDARQVAAKVEALRIAAAVLTLAAAAETMDG